MPKSTYSLNYSATNFNFDKGLVEVLLKKDINDVDSLAITFSSKSFSDSTSNINLVPEEISLKCMDVVTFSGAIMDFKNLGLDTFQVIYGSPLNFFLKKDIQVFRSEGILKECLTDLCKKIDIKIIFRGDFKSNVSVFQSYEQENLLSFLDRAATLSGHMFFYDYIKNALVFQEYDYSSESAKSEKLGDVFEFSASCGNADINNEFVFSYYDAMESKQKSESINLSKLTSSWGRYGESPSLKKRLSWKTSKVVKDVILKSGTEFQEIADNLQRNAQSLASSNDTFKVQSSLGGLELGDWINISDDDHFFKKEDVKGPYFVKSKIVEIKSATPVFYYLFARA